MPARRRQKHANGSITANDIIKSTASSNSASLSASENDSSSTEFTRNTPASPTSIEIPLISALLRFLSRILIIILSLFLIFTRVVGKILLTCCGPCVRHLRRKDPKTHKKSIYVLHPNAINNGGGEKVLWHILREIPSDKYSIQILCSDSEKKRAEWKDLIQQYFGMRVTQLRSVEFINVKWTHRLVQRAAKLPFTLMVQSLISMLGFGYTLVRHAHRGDVLLDTTGFAFVYPVAHALGMRVVAYVHYPTISTDMLQRVRDRKEMYNNKSSTSTLKTTGKLLYYKLFANLYGIVGGYANVIMVNSTWTYQHIRSMWRAPEGHKIHIVHPPVNVSTLKTIPLNTENREHLILAVGQFRPEKDHPLQLRSFARFLTENPSVASTYKLVLLGSCRHQEDKDRVAALKKLANELNIDKKQVDFVVDAPFQTLRDYLARAQIGLHTMEDEHFGICVVEYQAAGLITLAHDSAGPRMDIVTEYNGQPTGFLARTEKEYARKMYEIACLPIQQLKMIQENARESTQRFSALAFANSLSDLLKTVGIETRPKKKPRSEREHGA